MSKHTLKLTKTSGYSYIVVIPKEFIDKYSWKEKQKIVVEDKGRGRLETKDWRSR